MTEFKIGRKVRIKESARPSCGFTEYEKESVGDYEWEGIIVDYHEDIVSKPWVVEFEGLALIACPIHAWVEEKDMEIIE